MRSIESYEREGRPFLDAARKAAAEQKRRAEAYPELVGMLDEVVNRGARINEFGAVDPIPELFADARALLARLEDAT